VVMQPYVKLL